MWPLIAKSLLLTLGVAGLAGVPLAWIAMHLTLGNLPPSHHKDMVFLEFAVLIAGSGLLALIGFGGAWLMGTWK